MDTSTDRLGVGLLLLVVGFWLLMRSINKDAQGATLIDYLTGKAKIDQGVAAGVTAGYNQVQQAIAQANARTVAAGSAPGQTPGAFNTPTGLAPYQPPSNLPGTFNTPTGLAPYQPPTNLPNQVGG
jgi:hypothetical protein